MTLCVFQSTLPARGATHPAQHQDNDTQHFNPRSPHGERPCRCQSRFTLLLFQSTLPARGATPSSAFSMPQSGISIHAPRTGSDLCALAVIVRLVISIHAPRTGSDRTRCSSPTTRRYFNPRSPHGERLGVTTTQEMLESISIHAPRTGSDRAAGTKRGTSRQFQSTLPARGAT